MSQRQHQVRAAQPRMYSLDRVTITYYGGVIKGDLVYALSGPEQPRSPQQGKDGEIPRFVNNGRQCRSFPGHKAGGICWALLNMFCLCCFSVIEERKKCFRNFDIDFNFCHLFWNLSLRFYSMTVKQVKELRKIYCEKTHIK